jgi:GT2 family glycosyltransferase
VTTPRVRVVVVDYNGGELTTTCLEHLVATDHPEDALEIVLVDNASHHSVVKQVREDLPTVRIIESRENLGFAGGCNLGMGNVDEVDYIALVNNDATVPPDWLHPLLDTLGADASLGAASPKILLARRYRELRITAETTRPGRGDARDLGIRISGARVGDDDLWRELRFPDGTFGPELDAAGADFQWTTATARLLVPLAGDLSEAFELRLDAPRDISVTITSGAARMTFTVGRNPTWHPVPSGGEPFDVVNNVGTHLVADGYAADRGWLERDRGQYERAEDVFAWCGAAVLLRATYLHEIGCFDERLFLYSEDLELAWRGLQRGWRHRYVPRSVVRHVHSATSARSVRAATLKERNRLLVLLRHGSPRSIVLAVARYILVTGSYARRDVVTPLRAGAPVRSAQVDARLRAFGGFLRWAPAMVISRRNDQRRRPI